MTTSSSSAVLRHFSQSNFVCAVGRRGAVSRENPDQAGK